MITPLEIDEVERLREAGYAVVPLCPTEDMLRVGAPLCFVPPDGRWDVALKDAADCYRAMIELGCL